MISSIVAPSLLSASSPLAPTWSLREAGAVLRPHERECSAPRHGIDWHLQPKSALQRAGLSLMRSSPRHERQPRRSELRWLPMRVSFNAKGAPVAACRRQVGLFLTALICLIQPKLRNFVAIWSASSASIFLRGDRTPRRGDSCICRQIDAGPCFDPRPREGATPGVGRRGG